MAALLCCFADEQDRFFLAYDPSDIGTALSPENVNWDLELTMEPGRRLDVTTSTGVPQNAPAPSAQEIADDLEARRLRVAIDRIEDMDVRLVLGPTVADMVGNRETIIEACGGNEAEADKVIAKALEMFGAKSLDDAAKMPQGWL